jgi:hypothetical protein
MGGVGVGGEIDPTRLGIALAGPEALKRPWRRVSSVFRAERMHNNSGEAATITVIVSVARVVRPLVVVCLSSVSEAVR